jgi:hypothetical protein
LAEQLRCSGGDGGARESGPDLEDASTKVLDRDELVEQGALFAVRQQLAA